MTVLFFIIVNVGNAKRKFGKVISPLIKCCSFQQYSAAWLEMVDALIAKVA